METKIDAGDNVSRMVKLGNIGKYARVINVSGLICFLVLLMFY